ncbi:hypothetical protein R3P38DRAFT_2957382 [Favolaschia claudopus]|uniref:Uncharacterized protein n=1 Tax=Favolaschia claudopus TaxID=2862362 RepID=A0AAW0BAC3_9AGAR
MKIFLSIINSLTAAKFVQYSTAVFTVSAAAAHTMMLLCGSSSELLISVSTSSLTPSRRVLLLPCTYSPHIFPQRPNCAVSLIHFTMNSLLLVFLAVVAFLSIPLSICILFVMARPKAYTINPRANPSVPATPGLIGPGQTTFTVTGMLGPFRTYLHLPGQIQFPPSALYQIGRGRIPIDAEEPRISLEPMNMPHNAQHGHKDGGGLQ